MFIRRSATLAVVGGTILCAFGGTAPAAVVHQYTFNNGTANDTGTVGGANGTLGAGPNTTVNVTGAGPTAQGTLTTNGTSFTGNNNSVVGASLPVTLANGITGDFTIEQYLTVSAQGAFATSFSIGKDQTHFILLNPSRNGGPISADFDDGGTEQNIAPASGTIPTTPGTSGTNHNHMVAITYQASNGNVNLYLDGASIASGTLVAVGGAGSPFGTGSTTNLIGDIIGANTGINDNAPFQGDPSLNGTTDEFRLYNNVQSALQVAADFTAGPTVGVPEPASLGLLGLGALGLLARRRRTT